MNRLLCPSCGQHMLIGPEHLGRLIRCPACNDRIQVPGEIQGDASAGGARAGGGGRAAALETHFANTNPWYSLGIGAAFTVVFYLALLLFKGSYVSNLFMEREWVPYVLALFFWWSVGILLLKYRQLQTQRKALLVEVLPVQIAETIDESNVNLFLEHIKTVPASLRRTYMVTRMRSGLEHFAVRRSNPDVARMAQAQSDIDASAINGSYSLLKAFLWAIPILGFIGTVLGISTAIAGFSTQTDAAPEMSELMASINNVTGGLGVAFDTTLVALVLSIFLAFPIGAMQKAEEDLLNAVDEYCNENLLKRLDDAGGITEVASNTEGILRALRTAVSSGQEEILAEFKQAGERISELQGEQLELLKRTTETVDSQLTSLVSKTGNEAARAFDATASAVKDNLGALGEGIRELNKVLKELDGKQVVIEKKKRGWFGKG